MVGTATSRHRRGTSTPPRKVWAYTGGGGGGGDRNGATGRRCLPSWQPSIRISLAVLLLLDALFDGPHHHSGGWGCSFSSFLLLYTIPFVFFTPFHGGRTVSPFRFGGSFVCVVHRLLAWWSLDAFEGLVSQAFEMPCE